MNFARGESGPGVSVFSETVNWNYQPPGELVQSIAVDCYRTQAEASDPDTLPILFFGGYGENRWATKWVVQSLGRLGVPAVGVVMPFNKLPRDRLAVEQACVEVPHAVGDYLKDQHGLAHNGPIHAVARSQGGGVIGRALQERPEGIGDLAFIAPVCLDRERDCDTREWQRIVQFSGRFAVNGAKQFIEAPLDPVNWLSIAPISAQLLYDAGTRRFVPKVGLAMVTSLNETVLQHVRNGHKVVHLVGANDGVFRHADVRAAYASYEPDASLWPDIILVPGTSHVASASKKGIAELGLALEHLGLINPEAVPEGAEEIPPPAASG